ncbi:MAG: tetratricopeptide repeat protein [Magnetococcales bacterium]|nr:tetratricopeptide repeat protein [Magnetococcales bacterium]
MNVEQRNRHPSTVSGGRGRMARILALVVTLPLMMALPSGAGSDPLTEIAMEQPDGALSEMRQRWELLMRRARIMAESTDLQEARLTAQRALTLAKLLHGPYHPMSLESKALLAELHSASRQWQEAVDLYSELTTLLSASLGPDHETTRHYQNQRITAWTRMMDRLVKSSDWLGLPRKSVWKRLTSRTRSAIRDGDYRAALRRAEESILFARNYLDRQAWPVAFSEGLRAMALRRIGADNEAKEILQNAVAVGHASASSMEKSSRSDLALLEMELRQLKSL